MRVDYDVSSVDGPRGRVLDVLNLHVPSATIAGGVHVALTVRDYDDLRGALHRDARGRSDRGDLAALRSREAGGDEPAQRRPRRRRRSPRRPSAPARRWRRARVGRRRRRPDRHRSTSGRSLRRRSTAAPIAIAGWRGRPLLLNFWATWCGPCVVEMPLLDRFAREQAAGGWRVLALAVDQADPVRRFVAERTLRLPVAMPAASGSISRASSATSAAVFPSPPSSIRRVPRVRRHLGPSARDLLAGWTESIR